MKTPCSRLLSGPIMLFLSMLLIGCAVSNEGAVDYRKAEPIRSDALQQVQQVIEARQKKNNQETFAQPSNETPSSTLEPLFPSLLLRKDVTNPNAQIEAKDKISIRLRTGYLGGCNESVLKKNPFRRNYFNFKQKNCEIAILFKAFELSAGQDFDFKPGAERNARLVYFSSDVQPGQFFNFTNLAVYGPIEYRGFPIGIDIHIIETDAEDKQAFALFQTLAKVGGVAYPPAAPALAILDKLGGSLINSGTDDVELRYTMVLDPTGGYGGVAYSSAEAGDYVFIREEDREKSTEWDSLDMDHNTGRVWKKGQDGSYTLYKGNSYLTVQILKNAGADDVSLAQNTYGEFNAALEKDTTTKAEKLKETLIPELEKLAVKRIQIKNFHDTQKLYESMVTRSEDTKLQSLAKQDAFDLYTILTESIDRLNKRKQKPDCISDNPPCEDSNLSIEQVNNLLKKLRARAEVYTEAEQNKFTFDGFRNMKLDEFVNFVVKPPSAA